MIRNNRKVRIIVTDHDFSLDSFNVERKMLEPYNVSFEVYNCKEINELYELASDAEIFLNQYLNLTKENMSNFENLKLIVKYTIGYDNIDIEGASKLGILVCNNLYGKEEVADHTMTLILSAIRKVFQADKMVREGRWIKGASYRDSLPRIPCIQQMTLGVIGAGTIGRQVIRKSKEFFKHIYWYDPFVSEDSISKVGGEKVDDLDLLLANADVVTIHTPFTPETYHCIDRNMINKMKDGVIFVNVARGALVDTGALINALKSGKVSIAALDTMEEEPLSATHPLCGIENVILTPHIGGHSEFTTIDCKENAIYKVIQFLNGTLPHNALNPSVFYD